MTKGVYEMEEIDFVVDRQRPDSAITIKVPGINREVIADHGIEMLIFSPVNSFQLLLELLLLTLAGTVKKRVVKTIQDRERNRTRGDNVPKRTRPRSNVNHG